MAKIDRYFKTMLDMGASDLHLIEGQYPKVREHGHIVAIPGFKVLDREKIMALFKEICPGDRWIEYLKTGDMDFAYAMGEDARFRANFYRVHFGMGAVFRVIPTKILTLDQLRAPKVLQALCSLRMGLVLVTGPTGSGKSTTLAAMLNHINDSYSKKILTIEDPIEFVHPNKRSFFIQREVGDHTESFASGLRAAGREDCDVILVGEMRDLETISLAISAAEMGVLVFGTLHTNSAAKTIDRVVNVFPNDQQEQVRSMLSTSIRGVVSQQLLRMADGKGRCAAHEIMLQSAPISAAIRQGQISKLNQVIQSGRRQNMITMDDSLLNYVRTGLVTSDAAFLKAVDKNRFKQECARMPTPPTPEELAARAAKAAAKMAEG
jgi:twitching motility protein PilT